MADETAIDDGEWELERPEVVSFMWDAASNVSDDDDSDAEIVQGSPASESSVLATAAMNDGEKAELPIAEGSTVDDKQSDQDAAAAETNEPEDVDAPASISAEPRDDETVRSWMLGEADEANATTADGASCALDSSSEASFASWACSDAHLPSFDGAAFAGHAADESVPADDDGVDFPFADAPSSSAELDVPPIEQPVHAVSHQQLPAVDEEAGDIDEDDNASEASFHIVPGAQDHFAVEPTQPVRRADEPPPPNRITRVGLPPRIEPARYGNAALTDERKHAHLNALPSLRAQLKSLGPLGEELYALAAQQAAAARRTRKHTPQAERGVVDETEWW
eukprot:CAMPEP_0115867824 /NCGR_PEP_ID=MMETSP0287-20121206/20966_1 /TAXON_ID=412157 /ORGANISM="Chrysochromulina rotalis, Strain UIO044" /LENGTH=336 /DNA_ID=CAMNT_0003322439 /DNA_START=21 /DNA_END=1028 /DNA_ORIENTATION=-